MAKASRDKGKAGEREVVNILRGRGHTSRRTAPMQAARATLAALTGEPELSKQYADVDGLDGYHLEVKRCETLSLPAWTRQAEADAAGSGNVPVVVYRQSRQPWRVSLTLDALLDLYEEVKAYETSGAERFDAMTEVQQLAAIAEGERTL